MILSDNKKTAISNSTANELTGVIIFMFPYVQYRRVCSIVGGLSHLRISLIFSMSLGRFCLKEMNQKLTRWDGKFFLLFSRILQGSTRRLSHHD